MAVHGRLRALLVLAALGVALLIAACGGDDGEGDGAVRTSDEDSEQRDLLPTAWGYGGDRGPAIWGSLDPAYEACSQGERQSPIDLVEVETTAPSAIAFAYVPEEVEVTIEEGEESPTFALLPTRARSRRRPGARS